MLGLRMRRPDRARNATVQSLPAVGIFSDKRPFATASTLAVALAFGRGWRDAAAAGDAPYLLFVPAVLVAAAIGGLGPGLLATALGVALGQLFVATRSPSGLPSSSTPPPSH